MSKRVSILLVMGLVVATLLTAPASAHHDDGKGDVAAPPVAAMAHEFANVVAPNAQEDANAPRSFAPCIRGMAADTFPCDRVDMLSHLTLGDLGMTFVNDMWGWTDGRRDYALVGGAEGTVIVDITDAKRPDIVGLLPTHTTGATFWRDIKVYEDHMYVVSEDPDHGLQVFDLTQVRGVTGAPVEFTETAHYDGFGNAHNLHINTDTGFAYVVGSSTCDGGLHMVGLADPADPQFAGCFSDHGYIHDTQCVVYEGPDAEHHGKELCFNSAAEFIGPDVDPEGILNTVSVVDVTDKENPITLDRFEYADDGYSHQGWLTPDQAFFLHNDELDEIFHGVNTTTRIWDMSDLDNLAAPTPVVHETTSIGHNAYTEGSYLYASNYTAGLRVFDTSGVADGELPQVAYFDMYPENDDPTFEGGTWSNYPYFRQRGIVGVSSMDRGLFILRPRLTGR